MNLLNSTLSSITPVNDTAKKEATARLDSLVKPLGSLGRLEEMAVKLAGITGKVKNNITKKCIVIMASDNGVWEEGVSSCPQKITASQTINFLRGIAGISILSGHAGSDIRVVDIGVNDDIEYNGLIHKKIRKGTSNMAKGPAMTREEAIQALEVGIQITNELVNQGYDLLGTGEMGIGNTSTSSAVLMSFTGCDADAAIGKGAGLSREEYIHKTNIIKKSLQVNNPDKNDPLDVISKVGGFDIAGMAGCFLSAACHKVPIVIDGFISAAAALVAYRMNPLVKDYLFPSHCSAEPGYKLVMEEIGLEPVLNLNMRLGEGTGCALAFNLIEAANKIICNMATFEEASIADNFLVDIR